MPDAATGFKFTGSEPYFSPGSMPRGLPVRAIKKARGRRSDHEPFRGQDYAIIIAVYFAKSNRSRFMTLVQAETKSQTKWPSASSQA